MLLYVCSMIAGESMLVVDQPNGNALQQTVGDETGPQAICRRVRLQPGGGGDRTGFDAVFRPCSAVVVNQQGLTVGPVALVSGDGPSDGHRTSTLDFADGIAASELARYLWSTVAVRKSSMVSGSGFLGTFSISIGTSMIRRLLKKLYGRFESADDFRNVQLIIN
jgi:hypothetical protein